MIASVGSLMIGSGTSVTATFSRPCQVNACMMIFLLGSSERGRARRDGQRVGSSLSGTGLLSTACPASVRWSGLLEFVGVRSHSEEPRSAGLGPTPAGVVGSELPDAGQPPVRSRDLGRSAMKRVARNCCGPGCGACGCWVAQPWREPSRDLDVAGARPAPARPRRRRRSRSRSDKPADRSTNSSRTSRPREQRSVKAKAGRTAALADNNNGGGGSSGLSGLATGSW